MKFGSLKRFLILRAAIYCSILLFAIVLYLVLSISHDSAVAEHKKINREIAGLNGRLATVNKEITEFAAANTLWEELSNKEKAQAGLRLNEAEDIFKALEEQYRLADVSLDLSKPKELQDQYKTRTTVVVTSDITVSFSAISDLHVFSFIQDLIAKLPGYTKIQSLSMSRGANLSADMIENARFGDYPRLVNVKLSLLWRNLKDITSEKEDS